MKQVQIPKSRSSPLISLAFATLVSCGGQDSMFPPVSRCTFDQATRSERCPCSDAFTVNLSCGQRTSAPLTVGQSFKLADALIVRFDGVNFQYPNSVNNSISIRLLDAWDSPSCTSLVSQRFPENLTVQIRFVTGDDSTYRFDVTPSQITPVSNPDHSAYGRALFLVERICP